MPKYMCGECDTPIKKAAGQWVHTATESAYCKTSAARSNEASRSQASLGRAAGKSSPVKSKVASQASHVPASRGTKNVQSGSIPIAKARTTPARSARTSAAAPPILLPQAEDDPVVQQPKSQRKGPISEAKATRCSAPSAASSSTPASRHEPQADEGTAPGWALLRYRAETFADFQKVRIAIENRGRAFQGSVDHTATTAIMASVEAQLQKELVACYKAEVPKAIRDWQKGARGIGEHMLARLLGHLGDPAVASPWEWVEKAPKGHTCTERCKKREGKQWHLVAGEPFSRSLRQLWAYCGHGEAMKRRKGMTQDEALAMGNPKLKMLVHLMAESCVKSGGPYREVYDVAKAYYLAERPEWSTPKAPSGHAHNAALRKVGKEILRDLWVAASTK